MRHTTRSPAVDGGPVTRSVRSCIQSQRLREMRETNLTPAVASISSS
jgi:hypothetical protein